MAVGWVWGGYGVAGISATTLSSILCLDNDTKGDTEGWDGILVSGNVPSVAACCAAWQCLGAQRAPELLGRLREWAAYPKTPQWFGLEGL